MGFNEGTALNKFILINDQELPPCKRGVDIQVVTTVDSSRNANGVMVGQKIGRDQYKIDGLEWSWLKAGDWQTILELMKDFFFYVTFTDPVTCNRTKIECYCGDRSAEPYWLRESDGKVKYYKDCKVNLVDTGRYKQSLE